MPAPFRRVSPESYQEGIEDRLAVPIEGVNTIFFDTVSPEGFEGLGPVSARVDVSSGGEIVTPPGVLKRTLARLGIGEVWRESLYRATLLDEQDQSTGTTFSFTMQGGYVSPDQGLEISVSPFWILDTHVLKGGYFSSDQLPVDRDSR